MNVTQLNNTLLEGVLRTILAFDVINTRLTLSQIKRFLVFADADERSILEVLDFLCESRILQNDGASYVLYSRQDDTLNTLSSFNHSPLRKAEVIIIPRATEMTKGILVRMVANSGDLKRSVLMR